MPRPDLVITMTTPPLTSLLGAMLQKLRGSKHFIWEMDLYPDIAVDLRVLRRDSLLARAVGGLADWSRRNSDGIIALGEDMKARLVARGIDVEKIHVADNWADGSEIVPTRISEGPLVVHYSGNLGLAHDVDTIAEAMQELRCDRRFRFVFAGGGPRREALKRFCTAHEIQTATFRSYASRANLGRSLAEGHVGLVTQLPETCGSVVPSKTYGIMAAGRPLLYIGPPSATPARILRKFRCGWQVNPGDAASLIRLLKRLEADRDLIREAGRRARWAFEAHYERSIGVDRVLTILGLTTARKAVEDLPLRKAA